MKAINQITLFLFCTILLSCSSAHDYKFKVVNETEYTINSFTIRSGGKQAELSIPAADTSVLVTYTFDGTIFNFTEPLLSLSVEKFSDSVNQYEYETGQLTSIPDLHKKDINWISISVDSSGNTDPLFQIRTND